MSLERIAYSPITIGLVRLESGKDVLVPLGVATKFVRTPREGSVAETLAELGVPISCLVEQGVRPSEFGRYASDALSVAMKTESYLRMDWYEQLPEKATGSGKMQDIPFLEFLDQARDISH